MKHHPASAPAVLARRKHSFT